MRGFLGFKRLCVLLLLIMPAIPALSFAEPQPTHGRVRVCGVNDTGMLCSSYYRYMPRAIMPDIGHMDRKVYLKWTYGKLGTGKRVWSISLVDEDGNSTYVVGRVHVYFPYLSVYSAEKGEYWKWTQTYSARYEWEYSFGSSYFGDTWSGFFGNAAQPIEPKDAFGFKVTFGHYHQETRIFTSVYIGLKDGNSESETVSYNIKRISRSGMAIGKVRILVPKANVRDDADLDAARIGAAKQYETYELLGVEGNWYKIRYSDSKEGYVYTSLAEVVQAQ